MNKSKRFLGVRAFTCVGSPCIICGLVANRIYNDWSEFIIYHGGGTEQSDGDDQIHGTDFKVDFVL